MKSMTGYAFSEKSLDGASLIVEVKTLNSSHRDIMIKMDVQKLFLENEMRKLLSQTIKRGRIFVFVTEKREELKSSQLFLDVDLAKKVHSYVNKLRSQLNLKKDISLSDYPHYEKFFSFESVKEKSFSKDQIFSLLKETLKKLEEFRWKEGLVLREDFLKYLSEINQHFVEWKNSFDQMKDKYQDRLKEKITQTLRKYSDFEKESFVDEESLLREISIFSEKVDVSEELTRFKGHLDRFFHVMDQKNEPIGKELQFILQELFREVNTLSSKCQNFDMSSRAVSVKCLLEKMKEQVQNIE